MVEAEAKRVLIFAHYFPPLAMGGVQRIAKFCKYLPEYGWEPLVITCPSRNYFALDSSMLDDLKGTKVFRTPSLVQVPIGIGESFENWRKRLKTAVAWVLVPDARVLWSPRALALGFKLQKAYRVDCILATAPPYSSLLAARLLRSITGLPLVVDFRDAWVDDPFARFPTSMHRILNEKMERWVVSGSARVVSINCQIIDGLKSRHQGSDLKYAVVGQGFDPDDFKQTVKTPDRFTICYTGSLIRTRKPDDLFRAVSQLVEDQAIDRRRLRVEIVGFCPSAFRGLARDLRIDDIVRFRGYVPHRDSVRHLLRAHLLWLYIAESEGTTVLTGKLLEYLGSGKRIVASVPEDGAAASLVRDLDAGVVVRPGDVESLKNALMGSYQKWLKGETLRGAPEKASRFDRRLIAGELAAILDEVARKTALRRS